MDPPHGHWQRRSWTGIEQECLRAILNKSRKQHLTKQQLYGHLPPISKITQIRRTTHVEHCWRNKEKLKSDVLLWTPSHGCASVGRPTRTYLKPLCVDTRCCLADLPEAVDDRDERRKRESRKSVPTARHDDVCMYIYMCVCVCVCVCDNKQLDSFIDSFIKYTSNLYLVCLFSYHVHR